MAQRRYGPIRGAGVSLTEVEGDKTIDPAALGWAGYAGVLEKGPVGELIMAQNKAQFTKRCGGIITDSLLPDAAHQYYATAAGAGGLMLVRVTDGNEEQAQTTLYARNSTRTPMGTIKADNGGRWGGKEQKYTADITGAGDLTETTITTGATMKTDEWKGGMLQMAGVSNVSYEITGNTAAGVVTISSDATLLTDWTTGGGTDMKYYLSLANEGKALSIVLSDGEERPDDEFGLAVYVDGNFVKKYPNLHTNPAAARYWVSIINNDTDNSEITAVDLWTGAHTPATRPANIYGTIATVTETVLTADIHEFAINSPVGGGNPTLALGTTNDDMAEQVITVTMTDATTGNAVSDRYGALGTMTLGTLFESNKWTPDLTFTAGATPLVALDTLVVSYKPFVADALIGGSLYPDKPNSKLEKYRITDNTHAAITVAAGSDLTISGTATDEFMVVAPTELVGGTDGVADLADADYLQQGWDTTQSPFNRVINRNMGLIKYATPGITSTAVQKAGVAYAAAKNHQYRYEAASSVLTENAVLTLANDTLGRSDFAVMSFPSYGYVADPLGGSDGKLKLVTMTGMIHGREARIAGDYLGYHKAQAGIDATLPAVLATPLGEAILDEEALNPAGIGIIKKKNGVFILWGDRTLATDPTWKWKHQREMMSYYEHVLQENFDWIVFMINDVTTQQLAISALQSFFLPEYTKRALRGDNFTDAVEIKIDNENNTDATMAAGDMNATILLQLADTVERFNIIIGKQGIFDAA